GHEPPPGRRAALTAPARSAEPEPRGRDRVRRLRAGGAQPDCRSPPVDGAGRRSNAERVAPASGEGGMRRRRHKLEGSTFPFLAVLLCAMGSLILMLLVLDRRAKAAARERAQRAAEQVAAEEVRIAEERKQEWDQRRQALHAELIGQEQELAGKIAAVE